MTPNSSSSSGTAIAYQAQQTQAPAAKSSPVLGHQNNMYTALLGLALLVLGATSVMVCLWGIRLFGSAFSIAQ